MEMIKRAWRGEEKLWKVFWLYNVVGGIVLKILLNILAGIVPLLGIVGIGIYLVYFVWIMVAMWRCAWNASARFWGYLVRILVVVGPILVGLIVAGVLVGQDFVKAAGCRKVVTEKARMLGVDPTEYRKAHASEFKECAGVPMRNDSAGGRDAVSRGYTNPCEQKMAEYAIANHADPKAYIAQNQAYLQQCNQAMANQPKP